MARRLSATAWLALGATHKPLMSQPEAWAIGKRIQNIIEYATYEFNLFGCRGLYNRHKTMYTLQLCLKIDMDCGKVLGSEFSVLIKGGGGLDPNAVKKKIFNWLF